MEPIKENQSAYLARTKSEDFLLELVRGFVLSMELSNRQYMTGPIVHGSITPITTYEENKGNRLRVSCKKKINKIACANGHSQSDVIIAIWTYRNSPQYLIDIEYLT